MMTTTMMTKIPTTIKPGIEQVQALADIRHYVVKQNLCTNWKSFQYCTTRVHSYHSPNLHPGPCSSVGMWQRTDRQTHRQPWSIHISPRLRLKQNVMMVMMIKMERNKWISTRRSSWTTALLWRYARLSSVSLAQYRNMSRGIGTCRCSHVNRVPPPTYSDNTCHYN